MTASPRAAVATIAIAVALVAPAAPVMAATRTITLQQNGTGACQGAMPTYEPLLRRRPLAIQNEGTAAAYVACSPPSLKSAPANDTLGYNVRVINNGSSLATVSCSAVIGTLGIANPVYIAKTASVGGGSSAVLTWRTLEGYTTAVPFNVSCLLPPGTGVSTIEINQTLDVGA